MENTHLAEAITAIFPEASVVQGKQFVELTVAPESIKKVCERLKDDSNLSFNMLVCLTGMDWGSDLGVTYHLRSTSLNKMIVIRTKLPDRDNPSVESICSVYSGAEFHEREAYDLLGIKFTGHPDLRRLFLDSTWGFPLRKDYKDDVNIISK